MLKTLLLSILLLLASALILHTPFGGLSVQETVLIAQIPVMAQVEAAQPTPQSSESETANPNSSPSSTNTSEAQQPETEEPNTKDTDRRTPSKSAGPYDMEAIKEFNRALYGS